MREGETGIEVVALYRIRGGTKWIDPLCPDCWTIADQAIRGARTLYRFAIESSAGRSAVIDQLRSLVHEGPSYPLSLGEARVWLPGEEAPFIGQVDGNHFTMRRAIRYNNSFLPRIEGHLLANGRATTVVVDMKLHRAVLVFMVVWCSMVAWQLASLDPSSAADVLGTLVLAVSLPALATTAFFVEANAARRILELATARAH